MLLNTSFNLDSTTLAIHSSVANANQDNLPLIFSDGKLCDATYRNRDNGEIFQDVRKLTLNCDSTFNWKHISCISRDTSFGKWIVRNNLIYLTSDKSIKKKSSSQSFGGVSQEYTDLTNSVIKCMGSFLVWKRNGTWTDTLFRR